MKPETQQKDQAVLENDKCVARGWSFGWLAWLSLMIWLHKNSFLHSGFWKEAKETNTYFSSFWQSYDLVNLELYIKCNKQKL